MSDVLWRPLRLDKVTGSIPNPFVKTNFTRDSYHVSLTDLNGRLWSQSRDRKGVRLESLNQDTVIDACEGAANMKELLQKLEDAVNGADGCKCTLAEDDKFLSLEVEIALPAPLGTLRYTFNLEPKHTELYSQLVLPLILTSYTQQKDTTDLFDHLTHKDHIIETLLSRLKATNIDISSVFPAAKSNNLKQAGQQVRGLAPFDKQEWEKSRIHLQQDHASVADMLSHISSKLNNSVKKSDAPNGPTEVEIRQSVASERPAASITKDNTPSIGELEESGSRDEEFQKQATPPALWKAQAQQSPRVVPSPSSISEPATTANIDDDETTDDEDDLDAPMVSNVPKAKPPTPGVEAVRVIPPPKTKGKLGIVGGKKLKAATSEVPPGRTDTAMQHQFPTSEGRVTEDRGEEQIEANALTPKRDKRGKLGIVGGKKKAATNGGSNGRAKSSVDMDVDVKIVSTATETRIKRETASPSANPEGSEPPKSSQEKANEKRAELKRQLEEAKNKPIKKKRRF